VMQYVFFFFSHGVPISKYFIFPVAGPEDFYVLIFFLRVVYSFFKCENWDSKKYELRILGGHVGFFLFKANQVHRRKRETKTGHQVVGYYCSFP
jgi:hypothetical protein